MVKQDDPTAYVPAGRVVVGRDQRTHSGIGPKDPGVGKSGGKLGSLGEEEVDFRRGRSHIVTFLVRHSCRSGSDDTHGISRDQDVGIGRLPAAVDHHIVDPVGEDEERTLSREHPDIDSGHASEPVSPYSSGIDGHGSIVLRDFARAVVEDLHSPDGIAVLDELRDFGVHQDLGSVELGVQHVGSAEAERVDRPVGHLDGAYERRIDRRFHTDGLLRVDHLGLDAGCQARFHENSLVVQVVLRQRYEKS